MLTREEQITALEIKFCELVQRLRDGEVEQIGAGYGAVWAQQLQAVTDALIYLRGMPNPRGVQHFPRYRRQLRMNDK